MKRSPRKLRILVADDHELVWRGILGFLLPKDQKQHAEMLGRLESACAAREAYVENLRRKSRESDDLAAELAHIGKSREPARFALRAKINASLVNYTPIKAAL
jgi:tryptophan 2,3-dioxygenase